MGSGVLGGVQEPRLQLLFSITSQQPKREVLVQRPKPSGLQSELQSTSKHNVIVTIPSYSSCYTMSLPIQWLVGSDEALTVDMQNAQLCRSGVVKSALTGGVSILFSFEFIITELQLLTTHPNSTWDRWGWGPEEMKGKLIMINLGALASYAFGCHEDNE